VHGCLDTTWSDRASEYLTLHFTRLYDDGLHAGLTLEQFAHGLNGYYGRDFDMFEHWRVVGLDRLEAAVRRFPASEGLREYLWRFAVEAGRPDVLPTLARACEQSGALATAQALIAEGEQRFAAGDLVAAAQTFDAATGHAPTLVTGWNDLAVVLHQLGDARAWFALERALFVAPADPDALINAATLLANQGDLPGAVQRLESVLRHDPENAAAGELLAALTAA
jgi:tetratricopeptide (TPR) repeat protein